LLFFVRHVDDQNAIRLTRLNERIDSQKPVFRHANDEISTVFDNFPKDLSGRKSTISDEHILGSHELDHLEETSAFIGPFRGDPIRDGEPTANVLQQHQAGLRGHGTLAAEMVIRVKCCA